MSLIWYSVLILRAIGVVVALGALVVVGVFACGVVMGVKEVRRMMWR